MRGRAFRVVIAWLIALAVLTPPIASAQTRRDPMDEIVVRLQDLVARMKKNVPALKGKRLAIGDFQMVEGRTTQLAVQIADMFETALFSQGDIEIVSRRDMCQIVRENKLWTSDQFDPKASEKMGMFSEADFVVPGRLSLTPDGFLSVRVLDTGTTRVYYSGTQTFPLTDALRKLANAPVNAGGCDETPAASAAGPKEVSTTAAAPSAPAANPSQLQVRVWADKMAYQIGEPLRIGVSVNRDAYVTLVDIGTSGAVTVLYPNKFDQNNFVQGGQNVIIPPSNAAFTLAIQGPKGMEQIRAIATETPVTFTPANFSNPNAAFRPLDRNQTRNITVQKKQVAPGTWAEDVIALEIRP